MLLKPLLEFDVVELGGKAFDHVSYLLTQTTKCTLDLLNNQTEKRKSDGASPFPQRKVYIKRPLLSVSGCIPITPVITANLQLLGAILHVNDSVQQDLLTDRFEPRLRPCTVLATMELKDPNFIDLINNHFPSVAPTQHICAFLNVISALAYTDVDAVKLNDLIGETQIQRLSHLIVEGTLKEVAASADCVSAICMCRPHMQDSCLEANVDQLIVKRLSKAVKADSPLSASCAVKLLRGLLGVVYSKPQARKLLHIEEMQEILSFVAALCAADQKLTHRLVHISISLHLCKPMTSHRRLPRSSSR
eukprot:m.19591 g.19591  ORF g.19591 m.19591 type:complete len:305 (-) comp5461_c0_seq2:1012-1926(-)